MDILKRVILWDFPRASWQYDVIVGVIVAFIFITPYYVSFGDRPKPAGVAMVHGGFWIEPQQLEGVPPGEQEVRAASLVNAKFKTHVAISSVETISDGKELKGYLAFPKP